MAWHGMALVGTQHESISRMTEDNGDLSQRQTQPVTSNPWVRTLLTWIQVIFIVVASTAFLAMQFLPYTIGLTVLPILLDAMAVIFILVLPVLEVIVWKQLHNLPTRGYWGFLFLLTGWGIGAPLAAIMVFAVAYLRALEPPMPLLAIAAVLAVVAVVFILVGLVIVFVRLMQELVQLLKNG
jgi:hypothetical protein